jgi:predicted porin
LSELAAVFATLDYSRFEPDDEVNTSQDVYGGLLGYNYHPTERFTISAGAGLNYNVTHEDGQKDQSDIGYRFQFNLGYQINDQTKATVALSRDTEPSGDGAARTRNRGSVGISYNMTEMTIFSLDGTYIDDQQTQSNSDVSRRIQVRPGVRWNITDDFSLQAFYQFRYKTFESSGSAIDNGAFITLRYELPDLNWSGF